MDVPEHREGLLSPAQVAGYLGVRRRWVIERIQGGEIVAYRVGAFWRISIFELRRFLKRNRSNRRSGEVSN